MPKRRSRGDARSARIEAGSRADVSIAQLVAKICCMVLVLMAVLFLPAGTMAWLAGWAFLGLFFGFTIALSAWLLRHSPDLLAERLAGIGKAIRECLSCSFRATAVFFLTGFTSDLRQELRAIAPPTLIVHGDRDVQAPPAIYGQPTARLVAGSTVLVYENAAHVCS